MKLFFSTLNTSNREPKDLFLLPADLSKISESKRQLVNLNKNGVGQFSIKFSNPYGTFFFIKVLNTLKFHQKKIFFLVHRDFCAFISLLRSYLKGFNVGYYFEFIIRGIGYRYRFHRKTNFMNLSFRLGYSHRVFFPFLPTINLLANKRFDFFIFSFYKSNLKNYSEQIRLIKPVDSYKGKGIKYYDKPLQLKVGKVR